MTGQSFPARPVRPRIARGGTILADTPMKGGDTTPGEMAATNCSWPWNYGIATLSVGLAVVLRLLLAPYMGNRQPFPTFYIALTLSAACGGRGPVLYTLGLGYVAAN